MSIVQQELNSADPIDLVVGSSHYVANHRLGELHINLAIGRTRRLRVSRFYWDLEEPVAVDYVRDLQYGALELAVKKAYCKQKGMRYALARDPWDADSVTEALMDKTEAEEVREIKKAGKPLVGPRKQAAS